MILENFIFMPVENARFQNGKTLLFHAKWSTLPARLLVHGIIDLYCVNNSAESCSSSRSVSVTRDGQCNDINVVRVANLALSANAACPQGKFRCINPFQQKRLFQQNVRRLFD